MKQRESQKKDLHKIFSLPAEAEISYDSLVQMAFDPEGDDQLCSHYQDILVRAKELINRENTDWYRFIFVMDLATKRITLWFD